MSRVKGAVAAIAITASLALTACSSGDATTKLGAAASPSADTNIINFAGTHGVQFGDTRTRMATLGQLATTEAGCADRLAEEGNAHPVFDRDKLVLMWAYPPLHTPEGVMVGTAVSEVKAAYPNAVALTPPPGTTTFPGLLARDNAGAAYLFLYDKDKVQKVIVGYEDSARLLYTSGVGSC